MNFILAAVLLATLLPGLSAAKLGLAYVDGKYFPVVSEATVQVIQPVRSPLGDYNSSRIWGYAKKNRACHYHRMAWYVGSRGSLRADVPIVIEETSKARTPGIFHFGPWLAHVPWQSLLKRSLGVHADVYHQCYLGPIPLPWYTRTKLYG